jgi:hypothetical protein
MTGAFVACDDATATILYFSLLLLTHDKAFASVLIPYVCGAPDFVLPTILTKTMFKFGLPNNAAVAICVPWLKDDFERILRGRTDDPGPSMNVFPFGQEGQSRIHTSATSLDFIEGIDVSSAVSRIASVGATVVDFKVLTLCDACAGIVVIAIVLAMIAIVISFFIKLILLNIGLIVNSF